MKMLAYLANAAVLAYVAYGFSEFGVPKGDDLILVILLVVAPVLSIICIHQLGSSKQITEGEESTLQLARNALRAKLRKAAGG